MRSAHCRIETLHKLYYHLKVIQVLTSLPKFCADRWKKWSVLGKLMFSEKIPYLNQQASILRSKKNKIKSMCGLNYIYSLLFSNWKDVQISKKSSLLLRKKTHTWGNFMWSNERREKPLTWWHGLSMSEHRPAWTETHL